MWFLIWFPFSLNEFWYFPVPRSVTPASAPPPPNPPVQPWLSVWIYTHIYMYICKRVHSAPFNSSKKRTPLLFRKNPAPKTKSCKKNSRSLHARPRAAAHSHTQPHTAAHGINEINENPWNQWKSMKIHEINENPWKSMKLMKINENPWNQWKSMKIHED